jgi:hypothetical protein
MRKRSRTKSRPQTGSNSATTLDRGRRRGLALDGGELVTQRGHVCSSWLVRSSSGHFDVVIGLFFVVVFMRTRGMPAEACSQ